MRSAPFRGARESSPRFLPRRGWRAASLALGSLVGLLALAAAGPAAAQTTDRVVVLSGLFEGAEEATFVLLDLETGRMVRHDPARASDRFPPASTFKIPNSLIALETGAVAGPGHAIAWDSLAVPREEFFPSSWARDQTLETAFRNSVYWYYQALARRIGPETYRKWLARFDYGNRDLGGGIDAFWLEGDLGISADEQVEFLRRLWTGALGVSERSTRIVKDLMLLEEGPGYRLRGKTGTAEVTPTRELGWIVGVVETPDGDFAYALNMEGEDVWETWPPGRRPRLVLSILEELEVLYSWEGI